MGITRPRWEDGVRRVVLSYNLKLSLIVQHTLQTPLQGNRTTDIVPRFGCVLLPDEPEHVAEGFDEDIEFMEIEGDNGGWNEKVDGKRMLRLWGLSLGMTLYVLPSSTFQLDDPSLILISDVIGICSLIYQLSLHHHLSSHLHRPTPPVPPRLPICMVQEHQSLLRRHLTHNGTRQEKLWKRNPAPILDPLNRTLRSCLQVD